MQPGFDRTRRNPQNLGDRRRAEAVLVGEREDRPIGRSRTRPGVAQIGRSPVLLRPDRSRLRAIARRTPGRARSACRRRRTQSRDLLPVIRYAQAGKAAGSSRRPDPLADGDPGLLKHVPGRLVIVRQPPCQPPQLFSRLLSLNQGLECSAAPLGVDHQQFVVQPFVLVHPPGSFGRAEWFTAIVVLQSIRVQSTGSLLSQI